MNTSSIVLGEISEYFELDNRILVIQNLDEPEPYGCEYWATLQQADSFDIIYDGNEPFLFNLFAIDNYFNTLRKDTPQKKLSVTNVFSIPRKLWITFLNISNIPISMTWNQLSKKQSIQLTLMLKSNEFLIQGKTRYKKEFVTCGGIRLSEINFKTMESRLVPGLFFGGEVLDIDGVTGGFNFQAAWTTAWIAAQQISSQIKIQ